MSKKKATKLKKEKRSLRLRFLTVVMLFVIFITGAIDGYCIYNVFGKGVVSDNSRYNDMTQEQIEVQKLHEEIKKEKEEGRISYALIGNEKNIDSIIINEFDAYDVLLSVQTDLGIYNAQEEYSYSYMRSNNYYDVYTMQQYYDGIEVYGYELKMTADKSGNLLSVNGTHAQLDGFDTLVSLSESDAYNYVKKYLKSEYQVTTDDIFVKEMGKKVLFNENDKPIVGYGFEIFDKSGKMALKKNIFRWK